MTKYLAFIEVVQNMVKKQQEIEADLALVAVAYIQELIRLHQSDLSEITFQRRVIDHLMEGNNGKTTD